MKESVFQAELIREIKELFPSAIVLKNDPNYIQGFPDLLILFGDTWAALECKVSSTSRTQPNQEYYVDILDEMAYAAFVHPENKKAVLDDIQQAFGACR